MKSNIIKGMILASAVALSSCSSTGKLTASKYSVNDDDVYYTRAKAGDKVDDIMYANQQNNNYNGDDDYYYYGDYASRINRFSNFTPFDYDDDFYFSYVPYNNGFGEGLGYDPNYYNNYYGFNHNANPLIPIDNAYNPYIYNPYDYGYSPFYNMGYDDYDYGGIYSSFIGGGGGGGSYGSASLWQQHHNTAITNLTNPNTRGIRTTQSPGITRIAAALPGRPSVGINAVNISGRTLNVNNTTVSRQTRDNNVYRPQQQQTVSQPSSSVSSGGGSSSAASSGGGGRPARP